MLSARRRGVPVMYRGDTHGTGASGWRRPPGISGRERSCRCIPGICRSGPCRVGFSRATAWPRRASTRLRMRSTTTGLPRSQSRTFRRRPRGGAGRLRRGIGRFHRAVCGKDRSAQAAARCRACCRVAWPERRARRRGERRSRTGDASRSRTAWRPRHLARIREPERDGRVYTRARIASCCRASAESWGLVVNEAMATGLPAVVGGRASAAHPI